MKRISPPIIATIVVGVAVLVGGAIWAYWATTTPTAANHTALDTAWRGHGLGAPFELTSSQWEPQAAGGSGQWAYQYTAKTAIATAYAAAQTQLSGGGYQTLAASPDQAPHNGSAKIFRESITDNISVTIQLQAPDASTGPTTAIVSVTQLGR